MVPDNDTLTELLSKDCGGISLASSLNTLDCRQGLSLREATQSSRVFVFCVLTGTGRHLPQMKRRPSSSCNRTVATTLLLLCSGVSEDDA